MTIVLAILIFALLILVHEGGHFLAAKLCGVRVLEFALGLGPAIFKKKFGETDYAVRALPFGGQCVMEGEDEASDDPHAFNNAKAWKRLIILAAGVFMNFLMGIVILFCLYAPAQGFVTPTVDGFMDKFTAEGENGLMVGDTFLEINGYNVYLSSDVTTGLSKSTDGCHDIWILRDGEKVHLENVRIEPQEYELDGKSVWYYGLNMGTIPATFGVKLQYTWYTAINVVRSVMEGLKSLFSGAVKVTDLSGPIGISAAMSSMAKESMANFWYLAAFIAINLAVMNLLPVPALDGARIVFVLLEMLLGKPVNRKVEGYIHAGGLILLLALMVFVAGHDVWNLIRK